MQQQQQQHPLEQQSADKKLASALLKDGWRAFRRGDGPTARELWTHAASRFPSSAAACRARAYIAEALDRDNATAARHYEQALRAEPTDTTTLFNYGVLLETTDLNSALSMFDRGAQLGDAAAGERASVLRAQIDELRR
jgi:Tfp pilus assembly protein PilF